VQDKQDNDDSSSILNSTMQSTSDQFSQGMIVLYDLDLCDLHITFINFDHRPKPPSSCITGVRHNLCDLHITLKIFSRFT